MIEDLIRFMRYIKYLLVSGGSPDKQRQSGLIYEFTKEVLYDKKQYAAYELVHSMRGKIQSYPVPIPADGHGACSPTHAGQRTLRKVVKKSSVLVKHGQLLYRIARFYEPSCIVELGTSAGLSTMYLALGQPGARVITVEGNEILSGIAQYVFNSCNLKNIHLMNCSFQDALSRLKHFNMEQLLVFIDGNHTYEATLEYFNFFMGTGTQSLVIVLHDINWSRSMHKVWNEIKSDPNVKVAVDLYHMGIVFNFGDLPKQNVVMRY